MIETTQTRSLFGPPRSLFAIKKRGPLFWAIFWHPKVAGGRSLFPTKRDVPFAQVPIFDAVKLTPPPNAKARGSHRCETRGS